MRSRWGWFFAWIISNTAWGAEPAVDFVREIAPLLREKCAGCHNDGDREGKFSVESFASLQQGTEHGPAVLPGDSDSSRLLRLVSGKAEPRMPPEGETPLTSEEVALLKLWIDQGAKGPSGTEPDRFTLHVPQLQASTRESPVTAISYAPDGQLLAVGRFGEVELFSRVPPGDAGENDPAHPGWKRERTLGGLPGKVTGAHFCNNGQWLVTASGVAGSAGLATLWDVVSGQRIRDFVGHRDLLTDAEVSPDARTIATCSYDRDILLWDLRSGDVLQRLTGHNGAVYDVVFSPDGQLLASASGDDTCKLWRVKDGERLDTLPQPLKEVYTVEFSRDGRDLVAGGADNQIRIWKVVSRDKPQINPLRYARFAHEGPVERVAFTPDGTRMVSVADDLAVKIWSAREYIEQTELPRQPDVAMSLAVSPDGKSIAVGRMDGSWQTLPLPEAGPRQQQHNSQTAGVTVIVPSAEPVTTIQEQEPNNQPQQAQPVTAPAVVSGVIHQDGTDPDRDCYAFSARAGEEWVLEIDAARSKSRLDSFIEVLTPDGEPVPRVLLAAVRDSYLTFRGRSGTQSDDFRLFNWEDMKVNELVYANGEVMRLWLFPRGPDSGFSMFPGEGDRWGYFGTTGISHAMGEPAYIVEAHPVGTPLISNGLPTFQINYENDDEPRRLHGSDSQLIFVAPETGTYVARVRDVRGEQGKDYHYKLRLRPRKEDFRVKLPEKLRVNAGSATELRVMATRMDEFDGPIAVHVSGVPEGFDIPSPILIESDQVAAMTVLSAAGNARQPTPEQLKQIRFTAVAESRGREIVHEFSPVKELKLLGAPPHTVTIVPAEGGATPLNSSPGEPLQFEIHPGERITLSVVVDRNNDNKEIEFGKADSGRNLPHGVLVDDIGLNGLMLLADENRRNFVISAYDWVPEQSRLFHLRSEGENGQACQPVWLHVRRPASAAGR